MYRFLKNVAYRNGAITSVVSVSTGQALQFIGKPEPVIMDIALDILKLDKSDVAMVGDLYDTDIMSGINVGVDTIHVQTGVTTYEELKEKTNNLHIHLKT